MSVAMSYLVAQYINVFSGHNLNYGDLKSSQWFNNRWSLASSLATHIQSRMPSTPRTGRFINREQLKPYTNIVRLNNCTYIKLRVAIFQPWPTSTLHLVRYKTHEHKPRHDFVLLYLTLRKHMQITSCKTTSNEFQVPIGGSRVFIHLNEI